MKRKILIPTIIIGLVTVTVIIYTAASGKESLSLLESEVQRGVFEVLVTTTGELQAERSVEITGPTDLRTSRTLRFGQIKIQDLIQEGTVVDSGDYVALLDRSEATNSLKNAKDDLEKFEAAYMKTRLDTTMLLRNLRDELINLKFSMEEMEIILEQSKFEPPATIRQAQINLDKATRALEQAEKNYKLRVQQAIADMREAAINLDRQSRQVEDLEAIIEQFEIRAPAPGMVIYKKEWGGTKRKAGSMISPWDLAVATLPDLSSMVSQTYVNEIDISKVKAGQNVRIGVDAFPEKKYTGRVMQVANIGEQLPNTDAKVFEVVIKLNGTDPILRPAMTTSNQIITNVFADTLFIPLEAVFIQDSIPYVVKKKGYKQIVVLGEANENQIIVEQGLTQGEKLLLSHPEGHEKYRMAGTELVDVIIEKRKQKKLEEERLKQEAEEAQIRRQQRNGNFRQPAGMQEGNASRIIESGQNRPASSTATGEGTAVRDTVKK